jgi:Zn-dependent protease with chaperone function
MQITILAGFIVVLTLGTSLEIEPRLPFWAPLGLYLLGSAGLSWLGMALPLRALKRGPEVPTVGLGRYRLLGVGQQVWIVGGLAAAIWAGYGWWVWEGLGLSPEASQLPLLWFLAGAAPLLLAVALHWLLDYPLQRDLRLRLIRQQVEMGMAERPPWKRRDYLLFCVRQDLLMTGVPLLLMLGMNDCLRLYASPMLPAAWRDAAAQAILPAASLAILVVAPWLIVRVWGTKPLPEGPLRETLMSVRRRTGVAFTQMLVWPTGMNVANAAVLGIVRPFRYALLTDALMRYMEPRDVEAVFHHEVRHVKAHHLFYLMLFVLCAGTLSASAGTGLAWLVQRVRGEAGEGSEMVAVAITLVLMGGLIVGPFGWISRRFERQCDTFAAWMMGRPATAEPGEAGPGEAAHSEAGPGQDAFALAKRGEAGPVAAKRSEAWPAEAAHSEAGPVTANLSEAGPVTAKRSEAGRITPEGAAAFCWALQRIVQINCSSLDRWNWRHGSIAWRLQYLMGLSATGGTIYQIERVVRRIKIAIWAGAIPSAALIAIAIVQSIRGGS